MAWYLNGKRPRGHIGIFLNRHIHKHGDKFFGEGTIRKHFAGDLDKLSDMESEQTEKTNCGRVELRFEWGIDSNTKPSGEAVDAVQHLWITHTMKFRYEIKRPNLPNAKYLPEIGTLTESAPTCGHGSFASLGTPFNGWEASYMEIIWEQTILISFSMGKTIELLAVKDFFPSFSSKNCLNFWTRSAPVEPSISSIYTRVKPKRESEKSKPVVQEEPLLVLMGFPHSRLGALRRFPNIHATSPNRKMSVKLFLSLCLIFPADD